LHKVRAAAGGVSAFVAMDSAFFAFEARSRWSLEPRARVLDCETLLASKDMTDANRPA